MMTPLVPLFSKLTISIPDQPVLLAPVLRSDFDILTDQTSSVATVADIFKVAFEEETVAALNAVIQRIVAQHGAFTVTEQVKKQLLDYSIELNQFEDGQVGLCRYVHSVQDQRRFKVIQNSLTDFVPLDVINLISAYDDQIAIETDNRPIISEVLRSTDRAMQRQLFEYANAQGKMGVLNEILGEDVSRDGALNLSNINLSKLDLSELQMNDVSFTNANLQGANLRNIDLTGATMLGADLSGADLTGAIMNNADLTGASLAGAILGGADFVNARLTGADLTGANMTGADLSEANFDGAMLADTGLSDDEQAYQTED